MLIPAGPEGQPAVSPDFCRRWVRAVWRRPVPAVRAAMARALRQSVRYIPGEGRVAPGQRDGEGPVPTTAGAAMRGPPPAWPLPHTSLGWGRG